MTDGPKIAFVAALIGDPARANMLMALMDGRALTASELAEVAGVTQQTASGHLSKLVEAALLQVRKQGRHRYFALLDNDVAATLEGLMGLAQRTGAVPVRTGPKHAALREARICYDHLAGQRGVELLDRLRARGFVEGDDDIRLTDAGRERFVSFGLDVDRLEQGRRALCRPCLDWSERRSHLGGSLAAALFDLMADRGWLKLEAGRVVRFSAAGEREFAAAF
jgi:DNA-binding transcriptional ArsR family regulator